MATIHFFTRTSTKDKASLVPIYVRLKYGRGIDIICKTDILTKPDNWSNETGQARQRADTFKFKAGDVSDEGRKAFNDRVSALRKHLEDKVADTSREDINADWLKNLIAEFWHPERNKATLYGFIEDFIEKAKTKPQAKSGRPVDYKTRREYQVSFDYLKRYGESIGKRLEFKDIDLEFYDKYIQFLQNSPVLPSRKKKDVDVDVDAVVDKDKDKEPKIPKKISVTTMGKKIKTLKTFLNAAKEEGKNPYELYKSKKFVAMSEESETIYLNEDELTAIYNVKLSEAKSNVRDLFLVGCWTGCRFSDIAQITPQSIQGDMIHIKQYKTGKKVVIPLHPVVTAILNKHKGRLPECISNQKFNEALKEIAKDAKIEEATHKAMTRGGMKISTAYKKWELVTTHTARRSFASNLVKAGFNPRAIMEITGHSTWESFSKYIRIPPDEYAKMLQAHWGNRMLKVV